MRIMNSIIDEAVQLVKDLEQKNKKIKSYVLTGAGTSKGSSIPTFRGEDGLWEKYDFEEIATGRAWRKNPEKLWKFYVEGIALIVDAKPNPAHYAITQLEEAGYCEHIITQNVDGLHQKAGSKNVLEIHGNIIRVRCTKCGKKEDYKEAPKVIPPLCSCKGMLRPDVVLFDEQLPMKLYERAFRAAKKANLAIIIGTSAEVAPAAYLPAISKENKATILVFNTAETDHSTLADISIIGPCEETLPKFVEKLLQK